MNTRTIVAAVALVFVSVGCGSTREARSPIAVTTRDAGTRRGHVDDHPAPESICERATRCCHAFWGAHDVLTADLTREDIDCHETQGVSDATCEELIEGWQQQTAEVIDVSRRAEVEEACG